jgi:hypothetical protein
VGKYCLGTFRVQQPVDRTVDRAISAHSNDNRPTGFRGVGCNLDLMTALSGFEFFDVPPEIFRYFRQRTGHFPSAPMARFGVDEYQRAFFA